MGYKQKHPYIAQIGYILRYALRDKFERFTWMFKVKDCRHVCIFCEFYEMCRCEGNRREVKADEHEKCNEE